MKLRILPSLDAKSADSHYKKARKALPPVINPFVLDGN
jgi:hypothetical protein